MMTAGLYIHIPFCLKKCGYCDFYSIRAGPNQIDAFMAACIDEIGFYHEHPIFSQAKFQTIYFGGGTPSILSAVQINCLLEKIHNTFSFMPNYEFTIEANPETLSLEKLDAYHAIGINRLSLGVQSFHDRELKILDRIHSATQAIKSIDWAYHAGFDNINLDLIFAIPGQTLSQWQDNLNQAIMLAPQHLSLYGLTVEEETPLQRQLKNGKLKKVDEEIEREMYLWNIETLREAGYAQYEISNFSRLGRECRHNQSYWQGSPYLGIGPSAHSFWEQHRQWNVASLRDYLTLVSQGNQPISGSEALSCNQSMLESIYLSLRTARGIDIRQFEERFQLSFFQKFEPMLDALGRLAKEKLFRHDANRFQLTPAGFVLFDEICQRFANKI